MDNSKRTTPEEKLVRSRGLVNSNAPVLIWALKSVPQVRESLKMQETERADENSALLCSFSVNLKVFQNKRFVKRDEQK